MKLHVISLGCQMSVADAEEMSRPFLGRGFSATERIEEADAVLVNTCTVRQHAEDRAVSLIGRLREWKESRPDRFLIVAGCAAERMGDWLSRKFPHIDLVAGAKSIERYPELLERAVGDRFDWRRENDGLWGEGDAPVHPVEAAQVSSYVTIMRGCNYSCSYCIVPSVRGREIYRPLETILSEARCRAESGAREIVLLGQTVNSYRSRKGEDFADVLYQLQAVDGIERIRFMSPHPYYLNARMIAAMAESSKVARHIHLPLQSGSDPVLRRMRRNYTVETYIARLRDLRAAMPDVVLTTDAIAGFPGETEEDFQQTLEALGEIDPCAAYCFKFSPRPGTEAAGFEDAPALEIIEDRHRRLLDFMDARTKRHLESWVGREVEVLLETPLQGRTRHHFNARLDAPRGWAAKPGRPGDLARAVVTGTSKTGLEASVKKIRTSPNDPSPPWGEDKR